MAYCTQCGKKSEPEAEFCPHCGTELEPSFLTEETSIVEKGIASLAYMGILAIVPLLYAQKSAFVRMHALEGLNLLIYTAALGALCYVADFSWALSIAVFALMCCGVANALRGVKRNLPFVGRFKIVRGL